MNFNSGREKDKTESENQRFYGPASSCEELLKIGFTRNGFYLVKGNATSNNKQDVEIVDCLFKNPYGVKEGKTLINCNFKSLAIIQSAGIISQGEATGSRSYKNQGNNQIPSRTIQKTFTTTSIPSS